MNEHDNLNNENMNLDFEKMNEILADPTFANWYYNQMNNSSPNEININNFVQIIKDYSNNLKN
ncbi:hypothetical protein CHF27_006475 [Romboutsia maritimum]|uniref:Uncharacterized protein n=1 Tax=Romboutsia maritimum TaxID=2020948 RepID=A0A371ITF3_9FIRM|nr:hypothetical protein [Romboutsia maritimum]RDY23764.1 hypothetical protein CHF27_006475 [Romboutsia maritimum]